MINWFYVRACSVCGPTNVLCGDVPGGGVGVGYEEMKCVEVATGEGGPRANRCLHTEGGGYGSVGDGCLQCDGAALQMGRV